MVREGVTCAWKVAEVRAQTTRDHKGQQIVMPERQEDIGTKEFAEADGEVYVEVRHKGIVEPAAPS